MRGSKPTPVTLERILGNCRETPTGCLEWQGVRSHKGYGQMTHVRRCLRVHREVYRLTHGGIPEGYVVRHTCDNPPCCNPDHLVAGTQKQNVADREARGRSARIVGEALDKASGVVLRHEVRRDRSTGLTLSAKWPAPKASYTSKRK